MRRQEARPRRPPVDRYHLCFALGKALEDRGDYAESFGYYERGNALKKTEIRYRPEPLERNARLQMAVCTRDFFAARQGFGCPSPDPIFIVGLPRAGSTLLEQILASHSRVEGTMELADIPRLVHAICRAANPMIRLRATRPFSSDMSAEQFARSARNTWPIPASTARRRPFFIDKMPNNFRHIGLIHLILPNAKIIDARREPMACCFSNFKQLFASGTGIHLRHRGHRTLLPELCGADGSLGRGVAGQGPADPARGRRRGSEGNVRRMLDFCGLDFEPACLEFHKTERSVRTASSEQVRRPIYQGRPRSVAPLRALAGPLRSAWVTWPPAPFRTTWRRLPTQPRLPYD